MGKKKSKFPQKAMIVSEMTIRRALDVWMENLANNIQEIKASKDLRDLKPIGGPALIVGAGPSISNFNHLDILAKSNFKGTIVATDKMLIPLLEKGIVPQYVVCVDGYAECLRYFSSPIVEKYKDEIKAIFTTFVHPSTIKSFNGKKYFFHTVMDDYRKADSLTRAIYFMTHSTLVSCCGDCGSTAWKIAHGLNCNPLALIGMDLSEEKLEELYDYYQMMENFSEEKVTRKENEIIVKQEDGQLLQAFRKDYNPDFKNYGWTGIIWDSCWQTFNKWIGIAKKQKGVVTVNCTGRGIIHGHGVIGMKLEKFLKKYEGKNGTNTKTSGNSA